MLPGKLRTSLIIAVVVYFIIVLYLLKKRAVSLKYTLLWIAAGVIMGILVIWPEIMVFIDNLIGIQSTMNGLFIMGFAAVIAILMSLTSIVSRQNEKIRRLTQEMAMMEKRVRELEEEKEDEAKQSSQDWRLHGDSRLS